MTFLKLSRLFFLFALAALGTICVQAQLPDASSSDGRSRARPDDLPKGIKETLQKNRIEEEKKQFDEMIKRGEEAAKLSEELSESFEQKRNFTAEDAKKLARLEKLVKKIRDDLGGEDDKETAANDAPTTLLNALKAVQENAANLLSALKKTTRLTISTVAIESSNTVLKLVRFIRFYKN
jgi:hypothetical protein